MSQLTDALERIFSWMQQYELEKSFEPGLSLSQIESITKYLPFLLPEEVCELYQWKNGSFMAKGMYNNFLTMFFFSLEDAREEYRDMRDLNREHPGAWNPSWFPIFGHFDGYYCIMGSDKKSKRKTASLVFSYESHSYRLIGPQFKYTNLTTMMQTIAECCETGVYYLVEDFPRNHVRMNHKKAELIRLKYNPEPKNIRDELIIPKELEDML